MEAGKEVIISQNDIDDFFSDIPCGIKAGSEELTDFQKKITIEAYEKGYNKDRTAKKLGIGPKRMKAYYEDYKSGIK